MVCDNEFVEGQNAITNTMILLSQAVERRGHREEAFNLYKEAVRLSPDNALVRYRRAKILISMQRYQVSPEWGFLFNWRWLSCLW